MAAFLFDLDMTLLDTSGLEAWRKGRLWPRVMANLDRVQTFSCNPHEIPGQLKEGGHAVAVVTASPGKYAEALLDEFEIEYDVLIAFHDTDRHKPDPDPLETALEALGEAPEDAYHIGDSPVDIEAAYHAGVMSIGAGWGVKDWYTFSGSAPDVLLFDPKRLLREEQFPRLGYVAEVFPDGRPIWHQGSVLPLGLTNGGHALGRYFVVADPRHSESSFSQNILNFKDSDELAHTFARLLGTAVKRLDLLDDHGFVVSVPPKPKEYDRFEEMFCHLISVLGGQADVCSDGLKCRKKYESLKGMKAPQRQLAVKGAFASKYTWGDGGVILVDDVLTTQATIAECSRVLLRDEAARVHPLVLARDQHRFSQKECPDCGNRMVIRTKRATGERFWGCSSFPDCRHTESVGEH